MVNLYIDEMLIDDIDIDAGVPSTTQFSITDFTNKDKANDDIGDIDIYPGVPNTKYFSITEVLNKDIANDDIDDIDIDDMDIDDIDSVVGVSSVQHSKFSVEVRANIVPAWPSYLDSTA